jgi:hypothetical protein
MITDSKITKIEHSPQKGKVMAVVAMAKYGNAHHHKSSKQCSWYMTNGVFHTKGRGKLLIKFFEYSNSKEFLAEPDVFENDQNMGKTVFDLIIGCNSMEKLGIVIDFKTKTITLDEIILPMRNITNLGNKQWLGP